MTEPTRLLLIRHGETAYNAAQRIQGQRDEPLNARGLAQAQALVQALQHEPVDGVVASDLLRAVQTAEPLARGRGLPLLTDAGLRERGFGHFEGMAFDDIALRFPLEHARWRARESDFAAPGGGESLAAFDARCMGALVALARHHAGSSLAVVAHGGVLDCAYRAATGMDLMVRRTWRLPNAAINRLLWSGERLVLVGWCDDAHLADLGA